MPDELTLTIVGIDFPNDDKSKSNRRMELLFTPPGESVDLLLEHKNKHDSNASASEAAAASKSDILTLSALRG